MLWQFNNHCNAHNLIPDYQSAYRPNYSCEMALVKITNDILWAMEHQKATNLMAIDLSSAFDTMVLWLLNTGAPGTDLVSRARPYVGLRTTYIQGSAR